MSFSAIAWALEQGRSHNLPTAERMLLVALANAYNDKTGRCDPGQATLHADTGLTERHIRDLAVSLVRRGLLQLMKVGRALHYRLLRDAAPQQANMTPEPSSSIAGTIPEQGAAVVDTIREPSSGNGKDDTGTHPPRYRNSVPTTPELSSAKPIRETRETRDPPVAPPARGGRARRPENAFSRMRRELAAAHNVVTIDGDVVEFQAFHQQLRRVAHG